MVMVEQNYHLNLEVVHRRKSYRRASFQAWERFVREEDQCPLHREDWPGGILRAQCRRTASNNSLTPRED